MKIVLTIMGILPFLLFAQKNKTLSGQLIQADSSRFRVTILPDNRLKITDCRNPEVDTLLRTLALTRIGRKYLEHLLTTAAAIRIDVSEKIGILLQDGKYRLIAGLTGPDNSDSIRLVPETSNLRLANAQKNWVFSEISLQLFKGSVSYFHNPSTSLAAENVFLFDYEDNRQISNFSMDTILIEPIMHSELMYQNKRELYYFAGIHEILHTTPKNIYLQINKEDPETDAFILERKLFRKRKTVNGKIVKQEL